MPRKEGRGHSSHNHHTMATTAMVQGIGNQVSKLTCEDRIETSVRGQNCKENVGLS